MQARECQSKEAAAAAEKHKAEKLRIAERLAQVHCELSSILYFIICIVYLLPCPAAHFRTFKSHNSESHMKLNERLASQG